MRHAWRLFVFLSVAIIIDCATFDASKHKNVGLLPANCGPQPQQNSYTGYVTSIFDFPWMVILQYEAVNSTNTGFMSCLGTLINEKYVLAPAHCLAKHSDEYRLSNVRIGDKDTGSEVDCEKSLLDNTEKCTNTYQDIYVDKIAVHPNYRNDSLNYDIGLIRLKVKYDATQANAATICLPTTEAMINLNLDGLPAVVVGYDKYQTCTDEKLIKSYSPVIINTRCAKLYQNIGTDDEDTKLCAGVKNGGDVCLDLIGGLFVLQEFNNSRRYIQYGIRNGGPPNCDTPAMPGAYTPIGEHLEWILGELRF